MISVDQVSSKKKVRIATPVRPKTVRSRVPRKLRKGKGSQGSKDEKNLWRLM